MGGQKQAKKTGFGKKDFFSSILIGALVMLNTGLVYKKKKIKLR